jgi:Methane oxygenase PmoA
MRTWIGLVALAAAGAATATPAADAPAVYTWRDAPGKYVELTYGDRPVLRYMCAAFDDTSPATREATFKVYHHLYDPSGTRLVTNGPHGLYPHHRGLFYGFNKITYGDKKCDIWHGDSAHKFNTVGAYQEHVRFLNQKGGPEMGIHTALIAWHGPDKGVFAEEQRTVTAWVQNGGTLVDWHSQLTSRVDPAIKLDGDPQHAGFHFRADNEVNEKSKAQTYYLRPDGKGKLGETRNWDPKTKHGPINLPWDAMSFVLGGKRYTALYIAHPANPKEARYSERDYGRFGSYFEYELTKARPLTVRYRIWLQEGEMTPEQADAMSRTFAGQP